jgi:hypothetical protein
MIIKGWGKVFFPCVCVCMYIYVRKYVRPLLKGILNFFSPFFTEDPEEGVRIVSRPFSGGDNGEIDADGEVLSEEDTAREIYNDLRGEHTKKKKNTKHNTTTFAGPYSTRISKMQYNFMQLLLLHLSQVISPFDYVN